MLFKMDCVQLRGEVSVYRRLVPTRLPLVIGKLEWKELLKKSEPRISRCPGSVSGARLLKAQR